jgi:hypothetical protein
MLQRSTCGHNCKPINLDIFKFSHDSSNRHGKVQQSAAKSVVVGARRSIATSILGRTSALDFLQGAEAGKVHGIPGGSIPLRADQRRHLLCGRQALCDAHLLSHAVYQLLSGAQEHDHDGCQGDQQGAEAVGGEFAADHQHQEVFDAGGHHPAYAFRAEQACSFH